MNARRNGTTMRGLAGLVALALATAGCASGGAGVKPRRAPAPPLAAPVADSITAGLWRFDESAGQVAPDAGPFRLTGAVGLDARTDFGRFRSARRFSRSADSFVYVPDNPAMESARGFTVEAWVRPTAFGSYELTTIASRWGATGTDQSWIFGIVGRRTSASVATLPSPGWFNAYVAGAATGRLVLVVQPSQASSAQGFVGATELPLDTWTHVAGTWDGEVVRLYVDGRLDTQYALRGSIRASEAPLLVGNWFDTRRLTDFSGQLELDSAADRNPYYAYEGLIDELRLSTLARQRFESSPAR